MAKLFVQWGAGNIGRSFVGQVFARASYQVTFIDIDESLIRALNSKGEYIVETVFHEEVKQLPIKGVKALHAQDQEAVNRAISACDLMGVSVGKNVWPHIAEQLATAIIARYAVKPTHPLDIILAENIHNGANFVGNLLKEHLPSDFPLKEHVGLIETSIGKMVPIQTKSDPLVIRAEPHNDLFVNREAFLNPIPPVADLKGVSPMEAYGDRKLYIHNMGHATAAYLGFKKHSELTLIAEVLEDAELLSQVRQTMLQSMDVLLALYAGVFTAEELTRHIDDLLNRFRNKALGDTVFRVGRDLKRKLHWEDRLMGIIIKAQTLSLPWDLIAQAYLTALAFKARDAEGLTDPHDSAFLETLENLPLREKIYRASGWNTSPHSPQFFDAIVAKFEALTAKC
ncbi:MAG: mannitol-1-phosphate 5-dehydrogenase [Sphaerochaetaceae bacterium]